MIGDFIKNLFDIDSKIDFLYDIYTKLPGLLKFFIAVAFLILILLGVKSLIKDVVLKLPIKIASIVLFLFLLFIVISFFMQS